jgi:predicted  nucleic acid-binding Zn-ribbon protein
MIASAVLRRPFRWAGRLTWGAVKASPEAQLRLLELADFDAELSRLDHRRRTLPEIEEADRIEGRDRELHDEIVALEAEEKDFGREQGKAEADVEQVRARVDRDRKRLDGGQVSSARELENLQSEIAPLVRRQSDLEETVLTMERRRARRAAGRPGRRAVRAG